MRKPYICKCKRYASDLPHPLIFIADPKTPSSGSSSILDRPNSEKFFFLFSQIIKLPQKCSMGKSRIYQKHPSTCFRVLTNGLNHYLIKLRQIPRTALLLLIPMFHIGQRCMFLQAAIYLWCGFVDQVIGGYAGRVLQDFRQIVPEVRTLLSVFFVYPQTPVELFIIVLRPAHAR